MNGGAVTKQLCAEYLRYVVVTSSGVQLLDVNLRYVH
jgi:hypothetical protein